MQDFKTNGVLKVEDAVYKAAKETFLSHCVSDEDTLNTMRSVFAETGELLDPHTAIGYRAATKLFPNSDHPVVTLATASPAKFADACIKAVGSPAPLPAHLKDLMTREERLTKLPNDLGKVEDWISKTL
jgi:threonine synthase